MFGRQSMSSGGGGNLVEFRAGRMNMIGKMVHPDTRKGLVYLTQSKRFWKKFKFFKFFVL